MCGRWNKIRREFGDAAGMFGILKKQNCIFITFWWQYFLPNIFNPTNSVSSYFLHGLHKCSWLQRKHSWMFRAWLCDSVCVLTLTCNSTIIKAPLHPLMCFQSAPWTFCFPSGLTSVYWFWNSLGKSVLNGILRERIIGLGTKRGSNGRKWRSEMKELHWWRRWASWTGPLARHQAHYLSFTDCTQQNQRGLPLCKSVCVCKTYFVLKCTVKGPNLKKIFESLCVRKIEKWKMLLYFSPDETNQRDCFIFFPGAIGSRETFTVQFNTFLSRFS